MRASFSDSRGSWAAGAAFLLLASSPLAACTSLLGIDGNYVSEAPENARGGTAASAGGAEQDGGATPAGSGGEGGTTSVPGDGGTGGSGGGEPTPPTGGAGGALPPPVDAGSPDCMPGTYGGTFTGQHAPAVTFVGVPFQVSGPFTFTLSGTGRVLQVSQGKVFYSRLAWGDWSLDLSGEFDCDQQTFTGKVSGQISAPPAFASLQGTISGSLSAAGGVWQEQESPGPGNAGACKPGTGFPPTGTGCGTWKVTSTPHP